MIIITATPAAIPAIFAVLSVVESIDLGSDVIVPSSSASVVTSYGADSRP